tara:strand:- start:273 stop:764 length:492 start_codon:yes stop_codon:yes gene_type:complete
MNRRDFIKSTSASAAAITVVPAVIASEAEDFAPKPEYPYFVNCYIQNQRYWPLEEYKDGIFGGDHEGIKDEGYMGEKWIDGQLRFNSFGAAVEFIDTHSLVVPFYNEIMYEVFHEVSKDVSIAPKHIFTYWAKIKEGESPETIRWIRPDYIDHTADGALIERA